MDERGGPPLRVILHVPKCGGRTIQNHLERHLGSRFWSVNKRFRYLPLEFFGRKFDSAAPYSLDQVLAVSGHFLGRSIEDFFPGRQMVRSLVLREPQHQVLSWYNFRMMRYTMAGYSPYSFRLFLRSMPADPVTHFLLERWLEMPWLQIAALRAADKQRLLDTILSKFDAIVDISQTDELIEWHSEALGIPHRAVRANDSRDLAKRSGWHPIGLTDLSPVEHEELNRHLHTDTYVWRRWALKQQVTFDPATSLPFVKKELSRMAPQVWRRVARRHAVGTGLHRP